MCPEDIYGTQEIHINGAVLLAFQLYYHSTQVGQHPGEAAPGEGGRSSWGPAPSWHFLPRASPGTWEPGIHSWALGRVGLGGDAGPLRTRLVGAGASVPTSPPQDLQLFQEAGGWDVVSAVAEFWCSRVEWSPAEEEFHLKGEGMAGSGWSRGGGWSWGRGIVMGRVVVGEGG